MQEDIQFNFEHAAIAAILHIDAAILTFAEMHFKSISKTDEEYHNNIQEFKRMVDEKMEARSKIYAAYAKGMENRQDS